MLNKKLLISINFLIFQKVMECFNRFNKNLTAVIKYFINILNQF